MPDQGQVQTLHEIKLKIFFFHARKSFPSWLLTSGRGRMISFMFIGANQHAFVFISCFHLLSQSLRAKNDCYQLDSLGDKGNFRSPARFQSLLVQLPLTKHDRACFVHVYVVHTRPCEYECRVASSRISGSTLVPCYYLLL